MLNQKPIVMKSRNFKLPAILFMSILLTGLTGFSESLQAQNPQPVTVESSRDFEGTVEAIKKAVSNGDMMVLSELNQGQILSMTGLQLNAHSFFIGNPTVGKKAFSAAPSAGLVIPVRVNVYEKDGQTFVTYFKPSDLFSAYNSQQVKKIGNKMDGVLKMMMQKISN
jgi:uncharacterized protein (DUF302 family)